MSQHNHPEYDGIVIAAQWLSQVFGVPATTEHIEQLTAQPAQDSLRWLGEQLDAQAQVQTLSTLLTRDKPDALALHLERRYTALFEGIFRHRAVLPYESAWRKSDLAIAEMNDILRTLALHVDKNCCEPPDHLAIELAALAQALSEQHYRIAAELVERLASWVPNFSTALHLQDKDGFYAAAADVLQALLNTAQTALAMHMPKRHEGEFA